MSQAFDSREIRFAYKIRQALDESAEQLPAATAERLAAARRLAVSRKKAEIRAHQPVFQPVLAGTVGSGGDSDRAPRLFSRLGRLGLLWPLLALVAGLLAIGYWERQQHIADLADIDAAVLSDELPLSAYLDHGFNAYLKHEPNSPLDSSDQP